MTLRKETSPGNEERDDSVVLCGTRKGRGGTQQLEMVEQYRLKVRKRDRKRRNRVNERKRERRRKLEVKEEVWTEEVSSEVTAEGTEIKEEVPKYVIFDVGGERFRILRSRLTQYPGTRMGRLVTSNDIPEILTLCEEYLPGNPPEFFFDRNPECFPSILGMYRSGQFHVPAGTTGCAIAMRRDFEYWGMDELGLEPCCALKFYPQIELCNTQIEGDIAEREKAEQERKDEYFGNTMLAGVRAALWDFLEKPWTSSAAGCYAVFSLIVIIISTVTFIVSTFDELQTNHDVVFVIEIIDAITFVIFTVEYFMRFLCSPIKLNFFFQPMNLIDFLALVPFFMSLIFAALEDFDIIGKAGKMIRLMKVMRILRVYKLFRHFAGLQALLYTLKQAYKELGLLVHIIGVTILTFASLVYICESELSPKMGIQWNNKTIHIARNDTWNFIECFWWGLMTITTVGYDISPQTFPGKIFGGFCALAGVFTLTLPIPIVVNSFAGFYKNRLWRNEVTHKKNERLSERKVNMESTSTENHHKEQSRPETTFKECVKLATEGTPET